MAEGRRSYRSETPQAPPQEPRREERPVPPTPPQDEVKSKFHKITGLFPSKSGKSDQVKVTEEIHARLGEVQVGDYLGVSENNKSHRLELWYSEGNT